MNKVITINLDGNAYQLEEAGYDALHAYLENAADRMQGNPDKDEILSDIERAIAEKFRALLRSNKTVVETKEVAAVIAEMGPIEADAGESAGSSGARSGAQAGREKEFAPGHHGIPKRLYRIPEGAMIAGVCNGIAAYISIDPTFVRLAFVFFTMFFGTGLLIYIIMAIVVPKAITPEEKAAASGPSPTAQEFIRRAKEGYYDAMKNFPDRAARRAWKRRFRQEMRGNADYWRHHWQSYWSEHAPVHPGMIFTLPFLTLLQGAATILWLCAEISLLSTGEVLGRAVPGNIPVWVAALLLLIIYGILVGPLKAARHACYWGYGGSPNCGGPLLYLFDAIVWVAIVTALVCLAIHYFPELRIAAHTLPTIVQQAADDIREWWKGK